MTLPPDAPSLPRAVTVDISPIKQLAVLLADNNARADFIVALAHTFVFFVTFSSRTRMRTFHQSAVNGLCTPGKIARNGQLKTIYSRAATILGSAGDVKFDDMFIPMQKYWQPCKS